MPQPRSQMRLLGTPLFHCVVFEVRVPKAGQVQVNLGRLCDMKEEG
jgi:hypothetical protein